MILAIFLLAATVSAASTIHAEITVSIEHGGTAVITPQGNSPVPEVTELRLKDGDVGAFHITLDEAGEFTYTIKQEPDGRDITYDTSEYSVKVYVEQSEDGLSAAVVVFNDEGEKVDRSQPADPEEIIDGWIITGKGAVSFANSLSKPYMPGHGDETEDLPGSSDSSSTSPDDSDGSSTDSSDPSDTSPDDSDSSDPSDTSPGDSDSSDPSDASPGDSDGGSTDSSEPSDTSPDAAEPAYPDDQGGNTSKPAKPSDSDSEPGGDDSEPASSAKKPSRTSASGNSNTNTAGGADSPLTGDESRIEFYYMLAIASSAALFVLSLVYAYNTMKQS